MKAASMTTISQNRISVKTCRWGGYVFLAVVGCFISIAIVNDCQMGGVWYRGCTSKNDTITDALNMNPGHRARSRVERILWGRITY